LFTEREVVVHEIVTRPRDDIEAGVVRPCGAVAPGTIALKDRRDFEHE
jgi:hypothetical protein